MQLFNYCWFTSATRIHSSISIMITSLLIIIESKKKCLFFEKFELSRFDQAYLSLLWISFHRETHFAKQRAAIRANRRLLCSVNDYERMIRV